MPAGMIVAPQPSAVEAGARVLWTGGNAFDAALTCAAVQFVLDPHSCGVGGYLLLTCLPANGPPVVIDAPALAGERVSPGMWESAVIGPNPGGWGFFLRDKLNDDGYQSICTPGMIRGMAEIHRRFCTVPWRELFDHAIGFAEEGFVVGAYLAGRWKDSPQYFEGSSLSQKVQVSPEARRIYLRPDGRPFDKGARLMNPDYGRTLRRLAGLGPEEFYTGTMAFEMALDLGRNGGHVTRADLGGYTLHESTPVVTTYRGYTVVAPPAPHGGPTLAAMLKILEGYDLAAMQHNSADYILKVGLAMKAAFADRNRLLGDPRFVPTPVEWMTSDERAAQWRQVIDSGGAIDSPRVQVGPPSTTQVTVVDRFGNCVSLTHSLGSSSGVISPRLGFMYNNSMINFHPYAGHPNSIAAGKGRTTGMTPVIVLKDGRPVLVVGAPGATRIITAVLQTILNRIDFGMSIVEAVLAPRFDCQGEVISCQSRIPEWTASRVRERHRCERAPDSHGGFALVQAIALDETPGLPRGASDAGGEGMALAVEV